MTKTTIRKPPELRFMSEEQFEKLPRYAQSEILRAAENAAYYKKQFLQSGIDGKSRVYIDTSFGKPNIYLPEQYEVVFRLGEDETYVGDAPYVEVKLNGDVLDIRSRDQLVIEPRSSNQARIYRRKF